MAGFSLGGLSNGKNFRNTLLFKNNRLLFPYCPPEIFARDKAFMKGEKVAIEGPPCPPTREYSERKHDPKPNSRK